MAKKAYLYAEDGTRKIVYARDCAEQDKGKDYRCCGRHRGCECLAPLELRIGSKHENYFAVRAGDKHLRGCPNDETKVKPRTVKVLDPEGKNCTPQSLYEMFKAKKSVVKTGGEPKKEKDPDDSEDPDEEEEDENILPDEDLNQIKEAPKNFAQLVKCLLDLEQVDTYAGTLVSEQFCNRETASKYRKTDFPGDGLMTVVSWKTYPPRGYRVAAGEFVLAIDGTLDDKLYIAMRATDEVLKNLQYTDKKHRICIINRWKREKKFKNVFHAEDLVTKHMICVLE